MNEIINIPSSLRDKIENAQKLLDQSQQAQNQGNTQLAIVRAQEGMKAIRQVARNNPEFGALLVAGLNGYQGIEVTETEEVHGYEMLDQTFLGISFGKSIVPTHTVKTRTRVLRLI